MRQTETAEPRAEIARSAVLAILQRVGERALSDPRNFDSMLRDRLAGAQSRERSALVCALLEGIPSELRSCPDKIARTLAAARCTKRLEDERGLDKNVARWAVETWELAMWPSNTARAPAEETLPDERVAKPAQFQAHEREVSPNVTKQTRTPAQRAILFAVGAGVWIVYISTVAALIDGSPAAAILVGTAVSLLLVWIGFRPLFRSFGFDAKQDRSFMAGVTLFALTPTLFMNSIAIFAIGGNSRDRAAAACALLCLPITILVASFMAPRVKPQPPT